MWHRGGGSYFLEAVTHLPFGGWEQQVSGTACSRALSCTYQGGGHQELLWRPAASGAASNELGERLLAVFLHSWRSLTQGVGLSLVLGLWDLPELCFSIPVRGEAQMKMTQSGIQAD